MGNLINLASYRRKTRQAYLAKHGNRIDLFVEKFVRANIDIDLRQLAVDYESGSYGGAQASWDYVHFREVLAEALDRAFGQVLYDLLLAQSWFDQKLITQEEIVDRCLSTYVLSRCDTAN